ncbi:hypothetical protein PSI9734_00134 [Pseudidiomarina piscicola]|uniref:DUF58 domain-containing protein n=1 Tax=Pseudidiomarina piscicola TaxID=2614830 RepID=A0A6S6WT64_9GAMM|nr:DUF58 domain-containing protein [Pseudidiomarina piscicola]CAB0149564.1 hypothetical protein PSI9734_00134 [Pseudidiomarina piscicola]VZT39013.1 hypothetical protein PSI9734_00134 [Pseudomonas aeruginosa]
MIDAQEWLKQWQSNGRSVGAAELMYYRSKVGAFARHRRLHPPKSQSGALLSKTRGRGMEFDEVRHYQAGDDVRAIDWRVTARTGTAHTKLFREERERPVLFVVDLSYGMHLGSELLLKSVQSCHIAAAMAWLAAQRGDRVGAVIGHPTRHIEVRPQGRQHGVMRIVQQLVELQNESLSAWQQQASTETSLNVLDDLLRRTQHVAKPGSIIHVISDFAYYNESTSRLLQALQRHCSLQIIQCSDPLEARLPEQLQQQNVALSDGTNDWQFAAGDGTARQLYQQHAAAHQQHFMQELQQLNLNLYPFSAAQSIEQQWPEVMR